MPERKDVIDLDDFFMANAHLAAMRNKHPEIRVGACIVNEDNRIVGVGYNRMPDGYGEDEYRNVEKNEVREDEQDIECHAAINAIANKNAVDLRNCRMYITEFPCNVCTKLIIQNRINKVIYMPHDTDEKRYGPSRRMFESAEVWIKAHKQMDSIFQLEYSKISKRMKIEREGFLQLNEYFMATALLAASRSKDPITQVGACLVDANNNVFGVGYNGMPNGCRNNDYPWDKDEDKDKNKLTYVCHAELNAIANRSPVALNNSKMYVTRYPCNECAKLIIQNQVKEVFYLKGKTYLCTKDMFLKAGVKFNSIE